MEKKAKAAQLTDMGDPVSLLESLTAAAAPIDLDQLVADGVLKDATRKGQKSRSYVVLNREALPAEVAKRAQSLRPVKRGSKVTLVLTFSKNTERNRVRLEKLLEKATRRRPDLVAALERRREGG